MIAFLIWVAIVAFDVVTTALRGWRKDWRSALAAAVTYLGLLIWNADTGYTLRVAGNLAAIGFYAWLAWRNRPRGKGRKVAKLIGAKARQIRDRLIAPMPSGSTVPVPA